MRQTVAFFSFAMTARFHNGYVETLDLKSCKATSLDRMQTSILRPTPLFRAVTRPEIYVVPTPVTKGALLPKSSLASRSIGIQDEMDG
jgi:hypothetical protein